MMCKTLTSYKINTATESQTNEARVDGFLGIGEREEESREGNVG